jgi:phosphoenolpyruvate carboxykinase (ATP)
MSKFSTVIENMRYDPRTLVLDYEDDSLTPNMRCAYPLEFIANASRKGEGGAPKNIIFLTCDAFGVLPPIASLSPAQAIYHFLLGFTSKAPGTEGGVTEPEPTFSACFAAPFLALKPEVYGKLLQEKISQEGSKCWLVNTGWTGGPCGIGTRMPIKVTRAVLSAALEGSVGNGGFRTDKNFGFEVPLNVNAVDKTLLKPRDTWSKASDYDDQAHKLVQMFSDNFAKYKESVDDTILAVAL